MRPESEKYRGGAALTATRMTPPCRSGSAAIPCPRQRGFSLPLAIFIIVIMALIGTAMVSITQTGQQSVASEVQSIRTFYAAETGAQTAVARLLPLDGSNPGCGAVSASLSLTPADLSGCTVALDCDALSLAGDDYYRINSDARCSFADNDTRRQIEVMVKIP